MCSVHEESPVWLRNIAIHSHEKATLQVSRLDNIIYCATVRKRPGHTKSALCYIYIYIYILP